MRKVYAAASSLFGSLTIALLVLAALAVPTQMAFADSEDCAAQCSQFPMGSPEWNICMEQCMAQQVTDCKAPGCDDGFGSCTAACANEKCDKSQPAWICRSVTVGCRCQP